MTQRQKFEPEVNKPTEIELLYDECVSGNNQYGEYHLYAIKADGKEFSYFPPDSVHVQIKDLSRGDRAIITKLAAQRGSKIITTYDVLTNPSTTRNTQTTTQEAPSEAQGDQTYDTILKCYQDALRLQGELQD